MKKRSEVKTATAKKNATKQTSLEIAPRWFDGLNAEQVEVVKHDAGPCVVYALAGSGKTESLSRRIARMVANGVDPRRILAVTFSKKGADEMSARIAKKFGVEGARIGTWHSLCLEVLRETEYKSWTIDDKNRAKIVLKDVLGYKGMNWVGADNALVTQFIGRCKANLFTPDSAEALQLATSMFAYNARRAAEAFSRYNDELRAQCLLTFDDFLVFAAEYLRSDDRVRASWAARWDFVMQDEAQDANLAQKTIAELLARDHGNYMVIGDCFQAIYGFRGSSPAFLANFSKDWPGAKVIVLGKNYRSGRAIINAANGIVSKASMPGLEVPTSMVGARDVDGAVSVVCAESLDDEANIVADRIVSSVATGESKYNAHTILFRTNAQSRALEEALLAKRVPYVVVGGVSFYERKEVRDLLAYLRLANGTGSLDDIKRSINTPFRFLGARFVERVQNAVKGAPLDGIDWPSVVDEVATGERIQARQLASANEWSMMVRGMASIIERGAKENAGEDEKNNARPAQLLEHIIRTTRYIDFLSKEEGSETTEDSAAANVREMVRVAERFTTVDELLVYIDDTIKSARAQREDKQAGGDRVLLMSVHRSKGLEWPHVYVVGMNEMVLPHVKGDIEEERRLAYVAATRARDVLVMSFVRRIATRAGVKDVQPSRFLVDTGVGLDAPPAPKTADAALVLSA